MSSPTASGPAVSASGGVPGGTGHGGAPTAPTGGAGEGFKPASARDVGSMPEVDADACGRAAVYPKEAEQSGTEGDVRLRVALNDHGQVHAVRVLSGPGQGLDAAAIDAIKHRCHFTPAIGRDGQPVAFVIESYTFHFELPR
jgi:protein TonB